MIFQKTAKSCQSVSNCLCTKYTSIPSTIPMNLIFPYHYLKFININKERKKITFLEAYMFQLHKLYDCKNKLICQAFL